MPNKNLLGVEGLAHAPKNADKSHESPPGATDSGTLHPQKPQLSSDLAELANAWPTLPAALKAGILAMVKANGGKRQ